MAAGWRNPKQDLKEQSRTVFEQSVTLAISLCAMVFLTYQQFDVRAYAGPRDEVKITVTDIPITEQLKKPPPPQRPQIPIPTQDESVPEDVTIQNTEIDLTAVPPPPPPPAGTSSGVSPEFKAWEVDPVAIERVKPKYPDIARKAGVEGRVVLEIVVDEKGDVIEAKVVFASPEGIFEEAAREAILQWKFKPALQRDRPVKVRIGYPIEFKLRRTPPPA